MGMKAPRLGAHSGSLNKTLVARTRNLGASGDRAPVRPQPCLQNCFCSVNFRAKFEVLLQKQFQSVSRCF